jgi:hypothetical protein
VENRFDPLLVSEGHVTVGTIQDRSTIENGRFTPITTPESFPPKAGCSGVVSVIEMLRQRLKSACPRTNLTARDDYFSIPLPFAQLQKPA